MTVIHWNDATNFKQLYDGLNEPSTKLKWTKICQLTFAEIEKAWAQRVECVIANKDEPVEHETDSSDFALGAVLRQWLSIL